ncbi:MAG: penicillin-binding transpeptidase domain-containing protein [Chitinivibrionia bacterium]|nr:penicillin-binding transpeptidase domain-containing protein [Chitinivibrionia bacterium]
MTIGECLEKISKSFKTDGFINLSLIIFFVLSIFLAYKLWDLQIVKGSGKREFVKSSAERKITEYPRRGRILDRNGKEIAISIPEKSANSDWERIYSYTKSAPLIGYVKKDYSQSGLAGIEKAFDSYLAGETGYSQYRRDGRGNLIPKLGEMEQKVKNGSDIYLTIDIDIQRIVDDVLEETIINSNAKGGMAIVMDPHTGEIYAMASNPTFDPNINRSAIVRNKAISENYEPGSIFKIITFAAAINEGKITPEELIDCQNGIYEIQNERPIRDDHELGLVPYSEAFKLSSNIASLKIVKDKLGNKLFYEYCEKFGIGAKTEIGIPEEEKGIFKPLNEWKPRDALSMGFGNSVSVTLLQMATATSAMANGGYILRPQIYRKITDEKGKIISDVSGDKKESNRTIVRQAITSKTAETMRRMMSDVVNERGTGRAAFIEGLNIGGKTGTSKKVQDGKYLEGHYWASFIGITPIDKPVLVCVLSIDDPIGKYGGPVAGAAVAKIMKNIVASPKISIGKDIRLYKDTTNHTEDLTLEKEEKKTYPNFNGLDLKTARKICGRENIDFEIMGTGKVIISQNPRAGTIMQNVAKIVLYTDSLETETTMPNCIGVNVKDAIDMLRQRGIKPTFVEQGIGKVRKQYPTVGTFWEENSPCSLFVEKGISGL